MLHCFRNSKSICMLLLIMKSQTDEGFGRHVYKNVFLSDFIYLFLLHIEIELMSI